MKHETTVVNIRHTKDYDVYCGRPSPSGNPFRIGPDGTREQVMVKFKDYFDKRIRRDLLFRAAVAMLKGKILGCYCKPLPCHCDIIAEYLNMGGLSGHQEDK